MPVINYYTGWPNSTSTLTLENLCAGSRVYVAYIENDQQKEIFNEIISTTRLIVPVYEKVRRDFIIRVINLDFLPYDSTLSLDPTDNVVVVSLVPEHNYAPW